MVIAGKTIYVFCLYKQTCAQVNKLRFWHFIMMLESHLWLSFVKQSRINSIKIYIFVNISRNIFDLHGEIPLKENLQNTMHIYV